MSDTLRFDGSRTAEYDAALAGRLKGIYQAVLQRKAAGRGCLARPEADIGLIKLMGVLHHLEPKAGWARKAVIAYVYLLDHILRHISEMHWCWEWTAPFSADTFLEPEGLGKASSPCYRLLTQFEESAEDTAEFAEIRSALLPRYREMKKLVGRCGAEPRYYHDQTPEVSLPPLPDAFPPPLWTYEKAPNWPQKAKTYRERVSDGLFHSLTVILGDTAWAAYSFREIWADPSYAPGGEKDAGCMRRTFWGWTYAKSGTDTAGVEFYDFLFGAPDSGPALLAACSAVSRLKLRIADWLSLHGCEDGCFTPLLVGDRAHLEFWAQTAITKDYIPRAWTFLHRLIRTCVLGGQEPVDKWVASVKGGPRGALAECMAGLCTRNVPRLEQGVVSLLKTYSRGEWSEWENDRSLDLCLPAIAIQREALRRGLAITIPKAKNNSEELVWLPDPQEPLLPFCPYPGIDLVCRHDGLAWPSVLLGKPIRHFA